MKRYSPRSGADHSRRLAGHSGQMNQRGLDDEPTFWQDDVDIPARNRRHRGRVGAGTAQPPLAPPPRGRARAGRAGAGRRSSGARPPVGRRPPCCGRCRMTRPPVSRAARCGSRPSARRRTSTSTSRPPRSSRSSATAPTRGSSPTTRTYQAIPELVGEHTVSEDGLTHTMALRQGVMFHNGEEMKAADAIASVERWGRISGVGKRLMEKTNGAGAGRRLHAGIPSQRAVRHDPDRASPTTPRPARSTPSRSSTPPATSR